MSGPGPGPWQVDAEASEARLNMASGWIERVVLNPDKSYVVEWLQHAKADIADAVIALERAIQQAQQQSDRGGG